MTTIVVTMDNKTGLFNITRSRLRQNLLRHYFSHPKGRYYLRELERLLSAPVGNIRRELSALSKMKLFASEKVGNLLYFYLNPKYPLYQEIRNIVLKTICMGDIMRKKFRGIKGVRVAFIFGSFARGKEVADSDIDVMFVGDVSQAELTAAVRAAEREIGRSINYLCYTEKEVKSRLKNKNHFMLNVLKGKKIMLIGDENDLQRIAGK